MVLAAVRIASSRRSMSRSAESDAPMALSWSRRCTRSSAPSGTTPPGKRNSCVASKLALTGPCLLDADRAHFLDVRHPGQALLQAILLQGAHAFLQADGEHLRHPRMLLDGLLEAVG